MTIANDLFLALKIVNADPFQTAFYLPLGWVAARLPKGPGVAKGRAA